MTNVEHNWVPPRGPVKWPHCAVCGIIQRADGMNKPCKGAAPIALRAPTPRTDADYAIEHAEYLAVAAKTYISALAARFEAVERLASASKLEAAAEAQSDAHRNLNIAIYEFRKRAARALSTRPEGEPSEATVRVCRYVNMRAAKPIKGLDDVVHGIHTGTKWAAELRLSDLEAVLADVLGITRPSMNSSRQTEG